MNDLQKENKRLQAKVHSLNNANETLQRKLFEYDEMHNRLVTSLGYANIAEAMDSIIAGSQNNSNDSMKQKEKILRLEDALATQLDAVKAAEISIQSISAELYQTRQELVRAMEDIERLRHERYTARREAEKYAADAQTWRIELEAKLPEMQSMLRNITQTHTEGESSAGKNQSVPDAHDASGMNSSIKDQLERLKAQYQALLVSKEKITEKYKQDLIKWKRFKKWVVQGESVNSEPKSQKLIVRRRRSDCDIRNEANEIIPDHSAINQASKPVEESPTQPSEFPSSQTIYGILPSPVSRKSLVSRSSSASNDANEAQDTDFNSVVVKDSDLIGDSSHLVKQCPRSDNNVQGKIVRSEVSVEPSSPLKRSASDVILVPDTPALRVSSVLCDVTCSPGLSRKEKRILAERSNSEEDSPASTSEPAGYTRGNLSHYMQFKGRGRYLNAKESRATINSDFELNQRHHHDCLDKSTRRKNQKMLKGSDCECCREYYEALRPLPAGLAPPLWRSPSAEASPDRRCSHQLREKRTKDDIEGHKDEISRHRSYSGPPTTPPNFWKIGFPNTQEITDINRRAEDMHIRKYQRINKDAELKNGKYRRRV